MSMNNVNRDNNDMMKIDSVQLRARQSTVNKIHRASVTPTATALQKARGNNVGGSSKKIKKELWKR